MNPNIPHFIARCSELLQAYPVIGTLFILIDAGLREFMIKIYELPPGSINFAQTIGEAYDGLYAYAQATPEPDSGLSFFVDAITV